MKKPLNTTKRNLRFFASLILIIISIITIAMGFYLIDNEYNHHNNEINLSLINSDVEPKNSVLDLIDYHKYDEFLIHEDDNKSEKIVKIEDDFNETFTPIKILDYEENIGEPIKELNVTLKDKKDIKSSKKPRLVIIIDDVSFSHQVSDIKKLKLDITMSFLPPNRIHPASVYLARTIDDYMVHLPLEALKYPKEEEHTLNINDSEEVIEARIKKIREWFPKARYINNHTGSKFTSDKEALRKLYKVLKKYDFVFIDSKTTPESKVKYVAKEFNLEYIKRDIFLDNVADIGYIKEQLRKAVNRAKQKGTTIVICHPRKDTIKALANSHDILKDVEVVNINKLNF